MKQRQLFFWALTTSLLAPATVNKVAAADIIGTNTAAAGRTQQLNSPDQVPEGLNESDWTNIRAAYEAGLHAFMPIDGGWQARNPGQQWTTRFDARGFLATPRDGGWTWGLELTAYGFSGSMREPSVALRVSTEGQRLAYKWDATLEEWFLNDRRGLEHGFTVKARPSPCYRSNGREFAPPQGPDQNGLMSAGGSSMDAADARLAFDLAVRGSLTPRVSDDGKGVEFCDAAGTTVLNYSGLKVWDAQGRVLASHFEAAGANAVRLLVDERGARYPVTIDPIAQQAFLKASNTPEGTGVNDGFGNSVAVSGDTVVVGARVEDSSSTGVNSTPNEGAENSGAAYVFVRSGTTWSQQAYLKASNTMAYDYFGHSVAISGDTVVVGAYGEDGWAGGNGGTDSGAAYVFVRSGTTWSQQAYLKASNPTFPGFDDYFGWSVAISGDTAVVGARYEDSNTTGVNSTPNNSASNAGAAYVFVRSGTAWSQQAYLKASNTGAGDNFGISVAVSGDTVVVGALGEDSGTSGVNSTPDESVTDSGAAYVFVRSGTTWSQQAYLKASNPGIEDYFGTSVAISGDTVVAGASREDSSTTGVNSTPNEDAFWSGAAYVFVRSGSTWTQEAYLKASNTGAADVFGGSVAISGDTVVVGAGGEDSSTSGVDSTPNENATGSGAAYVFVRNGTTWSQQAYLKASNPTYEDSFGSSVAISGDTVLLGAGGEDSSTTGVNTTPNESASNSGAAYVFVRSGSNWSHQAYIKAGNNGGPTEDVFGYSVAISGDTVVVGAPGEDSSTPGVNGIPNDNAIEAGAAYVFVRNGGAWSQQAYLKASNTGFGYGFGSSVAISGDTVGVGSPGEWSSTTGVNSTPNSNAYDAGAAYVFVRTGTTWSQQAYLKASNTGAGDYFGSTVAVAGDTVVVGAWGEDSSTTGVNSTPNEGAPYSGAAYVFVRNGSTWSQQAYLKASNTGTEDQLGRYSVAISGDTVVVGSHGEASSTTGVNSTPNESANASGAAYVFVRSGTTWSQQAYLKASNTGQFDEFGYSVAISGDTLVVGSPYEDSNTTGVNSTPNENAEYSGAAYVFVRSGSNWSQQAYLKASNTGVGDFFGSSVAISGDLVVVGAHGEASSTTGVNSTPNESAFGGGAVYVFVRAGSTWSQEAYLKASHTGAGDYFGWSVAISGDTVVLGAPFEDSSTTGVNSTPNDNVNDTGTAYILELGIIVATANPLPEAVVGTPYNQTLAAVGGTPPYDWSLSSGSLPPGLSLSLGGVISGTPTAAINATFIVQVTDATAAIATKLLSLYVSPASPSIITASPLPGGTVGQAYSTTLAVTGSLPPYTWSLVSGSLPPGLILSTNGVLSGTPTIVTNAGFTVQVVGANALATNKAFTLAIFVNQLPEAIDQPGWSIVTGGSLPWTAQTFTTHDGVDAARSGAIAHDQNTWFETTLNGPGKLTYWWKVSSEAGYDFLEFYLNGVLQPGRISGEVNWQQRTNVIPAGMHTVHWRYVKDPLVVSGQDAGWVDQAVFIPDLQPNTLGPSNVVRWGQSFASDHPAYATNVVAIDGAGYGRAVGLRQDGTVFRWHPSYSDDAAVTGCTNVVAVIAYPGNSLSDHEYFAVRSNGSVAISYDGWEDVWFNATNDFLWPSYAVNSSSIGARGLAVSGSVRAGDYSWGNTLRETTRLTNVVDVVGYEGPSPWPEVAWFSSQVALKADGSLAYPVTITPGVITYREIPIPSASNIVALASEQNHVLALREDGTVFSWGWNFYGITNVPVGLSNVIAIAAGRYTSMALKSDGTVVVWGDNSSGQTNVPAGLTNVMAIGCNERQSFALLAQGRPFLTAPLPDRVGAVGGKVYFRMQASGQWPLSFQWRRHGTNLPGETNMVLKLTNLQPADAGSYSVVVSNALGETVSRAAQLSLAPFFIQRDPVGFQISIGGSTNLSVQVQSFYPVGYQWQFNGTNLPGATNATLPFDNVTFAMSGNYAVVVSNAFGVVTSAVARVAIRQLVEWPATYEFQDFLDETTNVISLDFVDATSGAGVLAVTERGELATSFVSYDDQIRFTPPLGLTNVLSAVIGSYFDIARGLATALRADGGLVEWGQEDYLQFSFPSNLSNVVAVFAGSNDRFALQADGNLVSWQSGLGNWATNRQNLIGTRDPLAIRSDGNVVSLWTWYSQTNIPATLTNVVSISGDDYNHYLGLRSDGTVAAWLPPDRVSDAYGETLVPPGLSNVVAVTAGIYESFALRRDGTLAYWGGHENMQTNIPPDAKDLVTMATSFQDYRIGVIGYGPPKVLTHSGDFFGVVGGQTLFQCKAAGKPPLYYQWRKDGVALPGATNSLLVLRDTTPADNGVYSVAVHNALGTNMAGAANLTVKPVTFPLPPTSHQIFRGGSVTLDAQSYAPGGADSYQWLFNGTVIGGATNATLQLTSFEPSQAGSYSLLVSNQYGVAASPATPAGYVNVAAWGAYDPTCGPGSQRRLPIPEGLNDAVQIEVGYYDAVALRRNRTVVAWGANCDGVTSVPPGLSNVVAIAASGSHNLALRGDGTVVGWGFNHEGQTDVPPNLANVVAIAASHGLSLALKNDGSIRSWGSETNQPSGLTNVTAIAAGYNHRLALRRNGTVAAWGNNWSGQTNVPTGLSNVIAIAAGGDHSLALRSDRTVVAWGYNYNGQTNVPPGLTNVIAIAAGDGHSLALLADRTVIGWGANYYGQTNPPAGLDNVTAIAAGGDLSLALIGVPPTDPAQLNLQFQAGRPEVQVNGPPGQVVTLHSSSNLVDWVTVAALTNYTGSDVWSDAFGTVGQQGFYRATTASQTGTPFELRDARLAGDGTIRFTVVGPPGLNFRVQSSTNGVNWTQMLGLKSIGETPVSLARDNSSGLQMLRVISP